MGLKRPFDDEEFGELPSKHLRQLEYSNKGTLFSELVPCNNAPQEPVLSGENEGAFCEFQWHKVLEKDGVTKVPNVVDKDLERNVPFSQATSSSSEEDAGSEETAYSSFSPEYFEFDHPQRKIVPLEDVHSSYLDRTPRKQVPLGPNHQASVPLWSRHENRDKLDLIGKFNPNIDDSDSEEKLIGTCVIPMPESDLSSNKGDYAGKGRTDCNCLDCGSIRCVRQHVMEAREKLRKSIGHENFVNLGFCNMGDEVACKWTEEEEGLFHEVVFTKPASLRRKFWKNLSMVFPYRSKKELVSYYFNVFMLQRRAVQNRHDLLDINSDDDEWHECNQGSYEIRDSEGDKDSAFIESLVDQDDQVDSSEEDDGSDDDDDDDGDDDSTGDGGVGHGREDVPEENGGIDHVLERTSGSDGEDFFAQDDSCMSFDCEANMADYCGSVDAGAALQVCGVKNEHGKFLHSKPDGDVMGQFCLPEPCDAKVWDARCPTASIKVIDVLPTWNMIQEFFGQDTWEDNIPRREG